MRYILLLLSQFLVSFLCAQNIDEYMQSIRLGSMKQAPDGLLNNVDPEVSLNQLKPYLADSSESIRSKAYYLVKRIGLTTEYRDSKKRAISYLIEGIGDPSPGISGNASTALTSFKKEDFTLAHKEGIRKLVSIETPHMKQVVLLAGYLEIDEAKGQMNSIISSRAPFGYKWAARLALARMGEQTSIDYILDKVRSAEINDDFIYDFVPDLVYTRQPEIYKYLEVIIHSDELNCESADPDANQEILCGYRLIEYLAPVIENYPLPIDEFGDLEIYDYEEALHSVRTWLIQNEKYSIKRDAY